MRKINLDGVTDNHKYKDLALLFDNLSFQNDLKGLQRIYKEDWRKYPDLASQLTNPTRWYSTAWSLSQKYKYPRGFTKAILAAATSGKVKDDDVINCYSKTLMHPLSYLEEYTTTMTREDLIIWVDPRAIRGKKEAILYDIELLLDGASQLVEPLPKNHPLNHEARAIIREHREWYWLKNKSGKGYKKLSQQLGVKLETLRSGIYAYKELLNY